MRFTVKFIVSQIFAKALKNELSYLTRTSFTRFMIRQSLTFSCFSLSMSPFDGRDEPQRGYSCYSLFPFYLLA